MTILYIEKNLRKGICSFFKKWWRDIDRKTFSIIITLLLCGIITALSISPAIANRIGVSRFHFAYKQLLFVAVAAAAIVFISMLHKETIIWSAIGLSMAAVVMLILVLVIGDEIKGAKRWLQLGSLVALQPAEILKPLFAICNAFVINNLAHRLYFKVLCSAGIYMVIAILLALEPDFGMLISYTVCWIGQLFIANISWIFLLCTLAIAINCTTIAYYFLPHVQQRVHAFFKHEHHNNYQMKKSIQSITEGGWLGKGPGEGVVKYHLPDAHSDYVFAVIGEEFGGVICLALVALYGYLIFHSIIKVAMINDDVKRYAALGIIFMFALQVIVNIGVCINILPIKGITLPFISYGGSSLISIAISFGVLLAFSRRDYKHYPIYENARFTWS